MNDEKKNYVSETLRYNKLKKKHLAYKREGVGGGNHGTPLQALPHGRGAYN